MALGEALLGLVGTGFNAYMQDRTNSRAVGLQDKQNAWNERMWNLMNTYNHPAAQARRLREAGINPALAFGGDITATASSPADGEASPSLQAPRLDPMVLAQINALDAQAEKARADAADTRGETMPSKVAMDEARSRIVKNKAQIDEIAAQIAVLDEEQKKRAEEALQAELETRFQQATWNQRLMQMEATSTERAIAAEYARVLMESIVDEHKSKKRLNDALKKYYDDITPEQAHMLHELAQYYHQNHTLIGYKNEYIDKHQESDRIWNLIFQSAAAVGDLADAASNFIPGLKPAKKAAGM